MSMIIPAVGVEGNGAAGKPQDESALLAVKINGKVRWFAPSNLLQQQFVDELLGDCKSAEETVVICLTKLLEFDDRERWAVLTFVASLESCLVAVGQARFDDLFDAALALMVGTADMRTFRRAKLAAQEAAVILFPEALDGACTRIVDRLRNLKVRGIKDGDVLRDAREIRKALHSRPAPAEIVQRRVREAFFDAPVAEDLVIPTGWRLSHAGVEYVGGGGSEPGMAWPVILSERSIDVQKGTQLVTLCWFLEGRWHERAFDREVVANTRSAVDLAAYGLPVHSNNVRAFVRYVADFEVSNLTTLPITHVARQMGWTGKDCQWFLWGKNLITSGVTDLRAVQQSGDEGPCGTIVRFRGADEGDEQIADGYHAAGSLEGWLQAVAPLAQYPKARLALLASLSAPMLSILDSPSYILSYAGATTGGKTTALRVGASAWGNPDETSPHRALATWDSTSVFRERAPAVLGNIPFFWTTPRGRGSRKMSRDRFTILLRVRDGDAAP